MRRDALVADLLVWTEAWSAGWPDEPGRFEERMTQLLAWQLQSIPAYASYAQTRPLPPGLPPLVPVTAFKSAQLFASDLPEPPPVLFHTSGTTDGHPGKVGWHDTAAYDASLLAATQHWLLPDVTSPMRVISLVPTPAARPHSSLGHMATRIEARWGDGRGGWFVGESLDLPGLRHALADAVVDAVPVLVLATSIAVQAWMEAWPVDEFLTLPPGSRLMDTGGPKGRAHLTDRGVQHTWLARHFAFDPDFLVGEFGMTELSTPRFETTLRARVIGDVPSVRAYAGTPWLRSLVLDPATRAPLPDGEVGMLAHIDLANVDSVAFLLTADLARIQRLSGGQEAVELLGRVPGSEWRGCGLDVEWLLP